MKTLTKIFLINLILITCTIQAQNYPVAWGDLVGASYTVNTQTLISEASGGWGNAGAASLNGLVEGASGEVNYNLSNAHEWKAFGLSEVNTNAHFNSIDYCFQFKSGNAFIKENGVNILNLGPATENTKYTIRRDGGSAIVSYWVNDVLAYTSAIPSTSALIIDGALQNNGYSLVGLTTDFEENSIVLGTISETGISYNLSGAGTSGTLSTGNLERIFFTPTTSEELQTLNLDLLLNEIDYGIDVILDIDQEGKIKYPRILIATEIGQDLFYLNTNDFTLLNGDEFQLTRTFGSILNDYSNLEDCEEEMANFRLQKAYDENGILVAASKVYTDQLGRQTQVQVRDLAGKNVILTESVFDEFGRPALQSLPAPKYSENLCYREHFIIDKNTSTPYNYQDYDGPTSLNAPNEVGPQGYKGSLGWYYSTSNTEEAYVPESGFPFVRTEYYADPMNRVKRQGSPGADYQLGSGHENRIFYLDEAGELAYVYGANKGFVQGRQEGIEASKTITVDAHGLEQIIYTDNNNRPIASCVSGAPSTCLEQEVSKTINMNTGRNFVDIHLPQSKNASLMLTFKTPSFWIPGAHSDDNLWSIRDLESYKLLTPGIDYTLEDDPNTLNYGEVSFTNANNYASKSNFLRIYFNYPQNYLDYTKSIFTASLPDNFYAPQHVEYKLDYSRWQINTYDTKGNIVKTIPPLGIDCSYDPTNLPMTNVSKSTKALCDNCNVSPSPVLGSYVFQNTTNNEALNASVSLSNPATTDHHLYFTLSPITESISPSSEHCKIIDDPETANIPAALSNYISDEGPISGAIAARGVTAAKGIKESIDNIMWQARREVPGLDDLYGGGLNFGPEDPVWDDPYCAQSGCDICYVETTTMDYDKANQLGSYYCESLNQPVKYTRRIEIGSSGHYFFCTECNDTIVLSPCKNEPRLFFAGFRMGVQLYGVDGSGAETPLSVGMQYVEAGLNIRYCDCSLTWDPNQTLISTGVISDVELDQYVSVKARIEQAWVKTLNSNGFVPYQAGIAKHEYLRELLLSTEMIHSSYPITTLNHSMQSEFKYDDFNRLIYENTPDEGEKRFVYDTQGKLRFSQNSVQVLHSQFSYINYDRSNRPVESGVYTIPAVTGALFFQNRLNDPTLPSTGVSILSIADDADGLDDIHCSERVFSLYDLPDVLAPLPTGYVQGYLAGRTSKSWNDHNTSWYSYDRFGRMIWMVQQIHETGKIITMDYTYDLLGNLKQMAVQKNVTGESFYQHYSYDANLRPELIHTSTDGVLATADLQAHYYYYDHGPLERVELGDETQGLDYAYTLLGQLKSINDPDLSAADPGADGYSGVHSAFAKDVFGIAIDYHANDYVRTGSNIHTYTNETVDGSGAVDQYNGNIKATRWKTRTELLGGSPTLNHSMYAYQYDVFNQLTQAQFGISTSPLANGSTVFGASEDYKVYGLSYDLNGNILSLNRNAFDGTSGEVKEMDDFTYHYTAGSNQLEAVVDNPTYNGNWTTDLDENGIYVPTNPNTHEYHYDNLGRMTRLWEGGNTFNYLKYNAFHKVEKITDDLAQTQHKVAYQYNERGQRIKKTTFDALHQVAKEVWYTRDASGNVISIYERDFADPTPSIDLANYTINGIGTWSPIGNKTIYELKDHLGTVRATIDRNKQTNGDPTLLAYADYYPFGMEMPGRTHASSPKYRLGYQGQEKDDETGWSAFDLRMLDSKIGRWLSPDPYRQYVSPYLAMGNNPINRIDPDGGTTYIVDGLEVTTLGFGVLRRDGNNIFREENTFFEQAYTYDGVTYVGYDAFDRALSAKQAKLAEFFMLNGIQRNGDQLYQYTKFDENGTLVISTKSYAPGTGITESDGFMYTILDSQYSTLFEGDEAPEEYFYSENRYSSEGDFYGSSNGYSVNLKSTDLTPIAAGLGIAEEYFSNRSRTAIKGFVRYEMSDGQFRWGRKHGVAIKGNYFGYTPPAAQKATRFLQYAKYAKYGGPLVSTAQIVLDGNSVNKGDIDGGVYMIRTLTNVAGITATFLAAEFVIPITVIGLGAEFLYNFDNHMNTLGKELQKYTPHINFSGAGFMSGFSH